MSLTTLGNHPKEELALVEIATAVLTEHKEAMPFSSLVQEIQDFLEIDSETFKPRLSQFYTDLNTDGSFISLGNNEWALRAWYPVDAIDESIHELDDEEDAPKRKKSAKKKVNVFADNESDDDVIDYNDDDPEDEDFTTVEDDDDAEDDSEDDDVAVDDDDDDANEIDLSEDESIDANMTELTGGNDLDDLGDGDQEK